MRVSRQGKIPNKRGQSVGVEGLRQAWGLGFRLWAYVMSRQEARHCDVLRIHESAGELAADGRGEGKGNETGGGGEGGEGGKGLHATKKLG